MCKKIKGTSKVIQAQKGSSAVVSAVCGPQDSSAVVPAVCGPQKDSSVVVSAVCEPQKGSSAVVSAVDHGKAALHILHSFVGVGVSRGQVARKDNEVGI